MTRYRGAFGAVAATAFLAAPLTTLAAKTFAQIVDSFFVPLGDLVVAVLYALAFLLFLFGVLRFFLASGNAEMRDKGKQLMLWGIIALVVLFGVWGIIKLLLEILRDWA